MNPILNKHLYSSVRRNRFFWLLGLYLLGVGLIAAFFLLLIDLPLGQWGTEPRTISMHDLFTQGRVLYFFSSLLLLTTATLLVPLNALGSLAGERDQRTLDLLLVTTLRTRSIVWGKMLSALLSGLLYVVAPVPLLMLGFWLGGVTTTELLLTFWVVGLTMVLNIAWALYFSARAKNTIGAVLLYYGLNVAVVIASLILTFLLVALIATWQYANFITEVPFWVSALTQNGWVLLVALHPFYAAITSEVLWVEHGSWLRVSLPVKHGFSSGVITLPLPWLTFTILALATTAILFYLTTRRLNRRRR